MSTRDHKLTIGWSSTAVLTNPVRVGRSCAFNAGADEVVKKPLPARDLANSLARVLQQ